MKQEMEALNYNDDNGNPAGGIVSAQGLSIVWQNGPLGRDEERREPNGCFVETVIAAAAQRLQCYQESKFKCDENAEALDCLHAALEALASRTKNREERKVEGTHEA